MRRAAKKPVIISMIGLVGSGKSSVAKYLAKLIGAKVIVADAARTALRKRGQSFRQVRNIIEIAAISFLKNKKSVVLDADFVDSAKRRSLEAKAKKIGVRIFYVRVFSYHDIMIGRLISAKYSSQGFFGGASSSWQGKNKGAVVALREMWRRTPHHYKWSEVGGGRFGLKKLPIKFLAEIDTGKNWRQKVRQVAKRLR